jgi:predicted ATP-grasp superfamily ATP-dependent carboligase
MQKSEMPRAKQRLIVAGVATRALAQSAARAGWQVTAVDAFGDLDLRACADVVALRREENGFDPAAAARAVRDLPADAVAYTANLENHPSAVTALSAGRRLLGNPAPVLQRVRDPLGLMRALRDRGIPTPVTRSQPSGHMDHRSRGWMLKPRRSGGGHGTTVWRAGQPVSRHQYLQERITGEPGSIILVADGRSARILGLSRQLAGRREFGASGFRYCGSLVGRGLFDEEDVLLERAGALAEAVTREYGLVGLNGVDFMARAGIPLPIEVNPRTSGSMELLERFTGTSLFGLHLDGCSGRLPQSRPAVSGVVGKAIVFARRAVVAGDPARWLRDPAIADVPHPGERIPRGRPICTVFATARDAAGCLERLERKARSIYLALEPAARGAA